jgi:hypothetical protein
MTDDEVEAEIQRKGLTAPRITLEDIEGWVVKEQYHVFEGTLVIVCCLTLRSGFTVTGESACASPENFDKELGQKIARKMAIKKTWGFAGCLLKEELYSEIKTSLRTDGENNERV